MEMERFMAHASFHMRTCERTWPEGTTHYQIVLETPIELRHSSAQSACCKGE